MDSDRCHAGIVITDDTNPLARSKQVFDPRRADRVVQRIPNQSAVISYFFCLI